MISGVVCYLFTQHYRIAGATDLYSDVTSYLLVFFTSDTVIII